MSQIFEPKESEVGSPALLTLDVEDWEHANFAQLDNRREKIAQTVRERRYAMDANTDRWIELLGVAGASSTCFVLGEFALRYPQAVKRLARAGHEIASHGTTHDLVREMSRSRFAEFLKRSANVLGELTGEAPRGFRAPSWSADPRRNPWFCEELLAHGFLYDSSAFPVATPLFGQGDLPLRPWVDQGVFRIPVTVLQFAGSRLPFSSGAFFRLAPRFLIRFGFRRAFQTGIPRMLVLHPRELDPGHPRLPLRGWEGWVHYARLSGVVPKLRALLSDCRWRSIREAYPAVLDSLGLARPGT